MQLGAGEGGEEQDGDIPGVSADVHTEVGGETHQLVGESSKLFCADVVQKSWATNQRHPLHGRQFYKDTKGRFHLWTSCGY